MAAAAEIVSTRELTTIDVVVVGAGITITMNRPHRRNAMNFRMIRETYDLLYDIANCDDCQLVVLTGADDFFSPGGDIKAILNGETDAEMAEGFDLTTFRVPVLLHEMPQVTLAAVNGPCAGSGLGWALGCDLRYATASATFTTAFLERAFAGDMSIPWSLPRVVGPTVARELSFLPSKISASRAKDIGLINDCFADDTYAAQVRTVVDRLLGYDRTAMRNLKSHYVQAERMQFSDYNDYESRLASTSVDPAEFSKFRGTAPA